MPQTLHKQEKEQFCKLFNQDHVTDFEDRFAVMEAFMQTDDHISSADMVERLDNLGHPLEPEFVRDTLKLMCQYGFASKQQFDNGETAYIGFRLQPGSFPVGNQPATTIYGWAKVTLQNDGTPGNIEQWAWDPTGAVVTVPEPGTMTLAGLALAGLAMHRRRSDR